jgi:2-dehydropantoate 2-reductase
MAEREPSVAVVGPGAVGGLVGALLSRAGAAVRFVARPATVRDIDGRRLTIHSARFGRFEIDIDASDRLPHPVDLCIVAVKAPGLSSAMELVDPRQVRGPVLPLLNGIDHVAQLSARYGEERTLAGAIRVEAARVRPTVVEHRSDFLDLRVAPLSPGVDLASVLDLLGSSGASVTADVDPARVLWDKLVFLAPFALVTAAHDSAIGPVREHHRHDVVELVDEVVSVGGRRGASLGTLDVLAFIDSLPASMSSSLRRDVVARAPDELDAIAGPVLRAAGELGAAVPTVRRYTEAVRARG